MTTPKQPQQPVNLEDTLTPSDEKSTGNALDRATDAEIEASIKWLDEIEDDRPVSSPKPPKA